MRKRFLATAMAAVMVMGSLAGCGGSGKSGNSGSSSNQGGDGLTTENITLKVWESAEVKGYIEAAGAEFTKLHPNITIEFVNVELGDTTTQIGLDGPAGVGADVFAVPCDKLGELVTGGHILAADSTAVSGKVLASCEKAATYEGTIYGYPVSDETYALYYNKALISEEEVPKTWEDMIDYAAANTKGDQYGFVMDPTTGYYTILFATANGNRLFGADGTDTSSTYLNTPDAVKGFELLQELSAVVGVPSADIGTDIADALFADGKAAMHISGPWNTSIFTDAGIDYGVTTLPSLPGETTPAVSFSGARLMVVSAYSDYPAEAEAFAEFLLTEEMQKLRYDTLNCIPSVEIAVDSEAVAGFMKQLDYAVPMPSVPAMAAFWETMTAASKNIWDGADVQSELDAADSAILSSIQ